MGARAHKNAVIRCVTLLALFLAGLVSAPAAHAVSLPAVPGSLLTGPSDDSAQEVTRSYLRDAASFGRVRPDLADLRLVARDVDPDGITHLRFNQVLGGVESFDRGVEAHVNGAGRLISISSSVVPGAELGTVHPRLDAREGLAEARSAVRGDESVGRPRLRWTMDDGRPVLAWQSFVEGRGGSYFDVLVTADTGELLSKRGLDAELGETRYFTRDPDHTPAPATVTMPLSWFNDSAGGTRLWGNNARTYADPGNENPDPGNEEGGTRVQIPSSNGSPSSPDWLYTPSHDFPGASPCPVSGCTWNSADPGTQTVNQFQAGSNLHVLVNRFHDHLAGSPIGFDEASGNFQMVNASGNGIGGDYLRAELNDGSGLNNARMMTPPEGTPPRMQMYLFSQSNTNGSDAAEVVYHEYTHGLSNRLVVDAGGSTNLTTNQASMMGEGWSDFYAQDLLVSEGTTPDTPNPGELTVGSYLNGSAAGVRAKPIDCPVDDSGVPGCDGTRGAPVAGGFTYGDLAGTNNTTPHNGGEIWSETLWDIREALGRQTALRLVTGGMRLIPGPPSMLDGRDAILQQAVAMRTAPGSPDDFFPALWQIFADRGLGAGASTPDANSTTPTESFSLPTGLQAGTTIVSDPRPGGDGDGRIEAGERFRVDQEVKAAGLDPVSGVSGTMSSGDPAVIIEDGSASWPSVPYGGSAFNSDELAGRLPAGVCSVTSPVTIDVSSPAGGTAKTVFLDPRPGSAQEIPLNDATAGPPGVPGVTTAGYKAFADGPITDVDVRIDDLRHTYLEDLQISVVHQGVSVPLLDAFGGDGQNVFDAIFDDEAAGLPLSTPVTGRVKPAGSLSAFDGLPAAGLWQLRIVDSTANDTGVLRKWGINSPQTGCDQGAPPPDDPVLDTTAPVIGKVKVSLKRVKRSKRKKATFRFSVNEPAKVELKLTRTVKGIRKGRRRTSRRVHTAGKVTMKLGRPLVKGHYRVAFKATDSASNRSKPRVVRFRLK